MKATGTGGAPRWCLPRYISNKEVAVKPKFAIYDAKPGFLFLYVSTSIDTKTLKIPSNRNFEAVCLASKHIFRFFHFCGGFPFASGNFAHSCVVVLNAQTSDQKKKKKKKKRVCNGLLFPGNHGPSSLTPESPVVLLVCGFRRRHNLLAWREMFASLYELKSRI